MWGTVQLLSQVHSPMRILITFPFHSSRIQVHNCLHFCHIFFLNVSISLPYVGVLAMMLKNNLNRQNQIQRPNHKLLH